MSQGKEEISFKSEMLLIQESDSSASEKDIRKNTCFGSTGKLILHFLQTKIKKP